MFDIIERARLNDLPVCHDICHNICHNRPSGLNTIIAIHSTRLEPALGGCRCLRYSFEQTTDVAGTDEEGFALCALGGILNNATFSRLRCKVAAGAANNQLATAEAGQLLLERTILYAPDYRINAGGLIRFSLVKSGRVSEVGQCVYSIADVLGNIFRQHTRAEVATNLIADQMAEALIYE